MSFASAHGDFMSAATTDFLASFIDDLAEHRGWNQEFHRELKMSKGALRILVFHSADLVKYEPGFHKGDEELASQAQYFIIFLHQRKFFADGEVSGVDRARLEGNNVLALFYGDAIDLRHEQLVLSRSEAGDILDEFLLLFSFNFDSSKISILDHALLDRVLNVFIFSLFKEVGKFSAWNDIEGVGSGRA